MLTMTAPREVATATSSRSDDDPTEILGRGLLRVVVTGSRDWTNYRLVCQTLDQFLISELHEGAAPGADSCARRWAISRQIPSFRHPANWAQFGRSAGPRRNIDMHKTVNPDLVVAFKNDFGANPRGGTEHMVSLAWETGTPVWHVDELGARWLTQP